MSLCKLIAICGLSIFPLGSAAQTLGPDKTAPAIARLETGVVCPPETVDTRPAPGTVAGYTNVIAFEPPFVSTINRVPAVLGIGFGAKAMAVDPDGISDVVMTVTHPPMGKEMITTQTFISSISGSDPSLTFYSFDQEYELLPGEWTMQAAIADEVLYKTSFVVLPPNQVPELAQVCNFEDLLS